MSEDNTVMPEQDLSEILQIRREKLEKLQQDGNNPFKITKFEVKTHSQEIINRFEAFEGSQTTIAGRIVSKRIMGKASFVHIQDAKGRVQSYVQVDEIGEAAYQEFKALDIGDIIGIKGIIFRTKRGEISVKAQGITLLSKSLKPLPEKWHGLKDVDTRYRQRYVDLIVNPEVKDTFVTRSKVMKEIRSFLDERGFLEVETPVLHVEPNNSDSRPFITHHNTLDIDMFMRVETEISLKKLIVGGFDRVYEIGRIFRNEGMSVKHNPEFTSIEMYQAYADYNDMMDLTEQMLSTVAMQVLGTTKVIYQEEEIDLSPGWSRLTMIEAVKQYAGVDFSKILTDADAQGAALNANLKLEKGMDSWGAILNYFFEEFVEEKLVQPTFIDDYPIEVSPLAKKKAENPALTERFEIFITRRELGNAFSELNDPIDQRARFVRQAEAKYAGDGSRIDEEFLNALEIGLPPTGGLGIGIDRFVMLLTDSASIRDVILFPTMKPKN